MSHKTINDIVNQVAVETGLQSVQDVFASGDPAIAQMLALANSCGYELLQEYNWQELNAKHSITTQSGDSGDYDLPADYQAMVNQTGWSRTQNLPVMGPVSEQHWTWLEGRNLVSSTIYASFRIDSGQYRIFPQPPPEGLNITFEYLSNGWVVSGTSGNRQDAVLESSDRPVYRSYLFERLLKLRFLEARGFDSAVAADQYSKALAVWKSKDKAGRVLNQGGAGCGYPYLGYRNIPDTGYGIS